MSCTIVIPAVQPGLIKTLRLRWRLCAALNPPAEPEAPGENEMRATALLAALPSDLKAFEVSHG